MHSSPTPANRACLTSNPPVGEGLLGDTVGRDYSRKLRLFLQDAPLGPASHDLVWSVNTINHLRDPVSGLMRLAALVRPGGRVALGQSSLLPDMCFAWDARLERVTNEAVRRYYRVRYGVSERDLAGVRSLVGWLRQSGLHEVTVRTLMLDRTSPLDPATETYLTQVLFQGTWGERLRPPGIRASASGLPLPANLHAGS